MGIRIGGRLGAPRRRDALHRQTEHWCRHRRRAPTVSLAYRVACGRRRAVDNEFHHASDVAARLGEFARHGSDPTIRFNATGWVLARTLRPEMASTRGADDSRAFHRATDPRIL